MVINDTVYSKKTEFGESIYKVRTVDVLPLDGDEAKPTVVDTEVSPPKPTEVETIEPKSAVSPTRETEHDVDDAEEKASRESIETNSAHNNEISREIDNVEVKRA